MSFEVRQETIKNLLTCGICEKLCREFMIIDECCHTFCKKCITKKITEENLRNCPKCNIDLGGVPLQKIKPDYLWQNLRNNYVDIREKLIKHKFMKPRGENRARKEALNQAPSVVAAASDAKGKGKEVDQGSSQAGPEPPVADRKGKGKLIEPSYETTGPEFVPFMDPSPIRRKEKSVSSLVSADGMPNQTAVSSHGKRKYTRRKPLPPRRASSSDMEAIKVDKDHFPIPNNQNSSVLPSMEQNQTAAPVRTKRKYTRRKPLPYQRASLSELEPTEVDKDRFSMSNGQSPSPLEPTREEQMVNNSHEHGGKPVEGVSEVKTGDTNGTASASLETGPRKSRKERRRKEEKKGVAEDLNIPTQIVVDSSSVCGRNSQIWFRLVACEKQESSGLLAPVIPKYLRVRDVNMRTSSIKKYLMEKLGLESDDKVEITMQGQPIHPDVEMHQLMEMWKSGTRSDRKKIVAVGSSGKDFVMVFTYSLQPQS